MPRYYFHVHDDQGLHDEEGAEFGDFHDAKVHAIRYAGRLLAEDPEHLLGGKWSVSVTLEDNGTVYEVAVLAMTVPHGSLN